MKTEAKIRHRLLAGAVAAVLLAAAELRADETNTVDLIKQLQRRIEELEKKVKVLESNQAPATVAVPAIQTREQPETQAQKPKALEGNQPEPTAPTTQEAKAKETPKITLGGQGFSFASANKDFEIQLHGVLQVDSRTFFEDRGIVGNDGFLLRRARPIFQGTVYRDFDFLFVPDFGGTGPPQIFDAYINYRYSPELQLQAGKYKVPFGLEQLQADRDIYFNERALPTDLVPNRDLGVELHGDLFKGALSYAAGIFNGLGDARNSSNADFEDDKAFAGRLFAQPFKPARVKALQGLGFGLAGTYESLQTTNTSALPATTGGTLPGYATVGQEQFFAYNPASPAAVVASGDHWRLSPQGYYYYGPFHLLGEYVISDQQVTRTVAAPIATAHLEHTAWQVAGGWVLTGEEAAFAGGVVPRRPFNPRQGGWGAWELVARYSELKLDPATFPRFANPASSAHSAQEWVVGLNWYLNRNLRLSTSFSHTTFDGGGAGTTVPGLVNRQDENVLFTRIQLAF